MLTETWEIYENIYELNEKIAKSYKLQQNDFRFVILIL